MYERQVCANNVQEIPLLADPNKKSFNMREAEGQTT